jgi:hypothetical protein
MISEVMIKIRGKIVSQAERWALLGMRTKPGFTATCFYIARKTSILTHLIPI